MRIGVDFDNTLVDYTGLFYHTAIELGWMPTGIGKTKNEVKKHFISLGDEPRWTELQGIVYGQAISKATAYPGALETLTDWRRKGWQLYLVSHKTRYPIIGERLDFHQAATRWMDERGFTHLFESIYFCPSKEEKLAVASELQLDFFIDDLPSILQSDLFPSNTIGVHFAADSESPMQRAVTHWNELLWLNE